MNNNLLSFEPNSPSQKAQALVQLETIKKQVNERIAQYKEELLYIMQQQKALTLKTEDYIVTRAKRVTPQVIDFNTLKDSLEKNEIPVVTEEVFAPQMDVVFKNLIEMGKPIDGLEAKTTEYIMVKVNKK